MRVVGNVLEYVNVEDAEYALHRVISVKHLRGDACLSDINVLRLRCKPNMCDYTYVRVAGVYVHAIVRMLGEYLAIYLSLNEQSLFDNKSYSQFISASYTGSNNYYLDNPMDCSLALGGDCSRYKSYDYQAHEVKKWYLGLTDSIITSYHHVHYTPAMTLQILARTATRVRKIVYNVLASGMRYNGREPINASFVTGLLFWIMLVPEDAARAAELLGLLDISRGQVEWTQYVKNNFSLIKSVQNIYNHDYTIFFEMAVLTNRSFSLIDWDTERANRVKPTLAAIGTGEVYRAAVSMFKQSSDLHLAHKTKMNWSEFWEARWQWVASGSVQSQYPEDNKYIDKHTAFKNKFVTVNKMPNDIGLDYFLDRFPMIRAKASVKYEWGKARAIYSTDLTSYLLFEFVMSHCEEILPLQMPLGQHAKAEILNKRVFEYSKGGYAYCADFEDFNSQHSHDNMAAVISAYIAVKAKHLTPDQIRAADWLVKSVYTQRVSSNTINPHDYETNGTLFSGWRLTTFLNTVLNGIYCNAIMEKAGILPTAQLHSGDDVLLFFSAPKDAFRFLKYAREMRVRINPAKCNLGSVSEFLRVDSRCNSDGSQYLSRAISTLVHGRVESKFLSDNISRLEANFTRADELESRGANNRLVKLAKQLYVQRVVRANLKYNSEQPLAVYKYLSADRLHGGRRESNSRDTTQLWVTPIATWLKEASEIEHYPGVKSYIHKLHKMLDLKKLGASIKDSIIESSKSVVLSKKRVIHYSIKPPDGVKTSLIPCMYAKVGSFSEVTQLSEYGKARMLAFNVFQVYKHYKIAQLALILSEIPGRAAKRHWLSLMTMKATRNIYTM